jgi:hypothetical protein
LAAQEGRNLHLPLRLLFHHFLELGDPGFFRSASGHGVVHMDLDRSRCRPWQIGQKGQAGDKHNHQSDMIRLHLPLLFGKNRLAHRAERIASTKKIAFHPFPPYMFHFCS